MNSLDNKPTVSIGMPVYNREGSLRQALDSLLSQDFSNFELIISDNASTDCTEEICNQYVVADKRIRYVRAEKNGGMHLNFNKVLELAQGEYFMWAASDDKWNRNFIDSLLEALEKTPDAAGAFLPYQFVEEETGELIEGVRKYSYENNHAFFRLLKFTWYYDDACIYGLVRKKHMKDVKFEPWAWVNAGTPYNVAYPIIYSLLAKGDFLLVGDEPQWFNSIRTTNWHSTPFKSNPLFAYFSHVLRKINLLVRSVKYIYRGSTSVLLAVSVVPFLLLRLIFDCITPVYAALYILFSGKKFSEISPHEIWKLGVR